MLATLAALLQSEAESAPAGGAAIGELLLGGAVAGAALVVVAIIGVLHRRRGLLDPLTRLVEDKTGLPAWAALPQAITGVALVVAVFGYYWDVSWHIDRGRDAGPFANPAHWFIIVGLDGIAFAAILAIILGDRKTPTSVRIREGWHAPAGGVLLATCAVIALAGFPLDDIWHRLFGQDVTAWGPTHIQMIGGASLSALAVWVLGVEGLREMPATTRARWARLIWLRDLSLGGAFLIGLSTLQVEFDFGVPQFRQLYHPTLIALAAAIGLVATRLRCGRGGAIGAALFFIAVRGGLALLIGPALGRDWPHFPLYLAEAVLVELVALAIPRSRQITFGAVCGLAIGTVGLAAEWAWSQVFMPLPWNAALLPEALVLPLVAAVGGGVIGGLIGRAVSPDGVEHQATPSGATVAAWVGVVACLALPLPLTEHTSWSADLAFEEVDAGGPRGAERQAFVTARLAPGAAAEAAADAEWFHALAWQGRPEGDDGLVIADFERQPDGSYRSERPVPLEGTWKTAVRLHAGDSMQIVPLYLPEDDAIPAEAVQAEEGSTQFVREKSFLQREAKTDNVGLERAAYGALAAVALLWMVVLGWGIRRLDRAYAGGPASRASEPVPGGAPLPQT